MSDLQHWDSILGGTEGPPGPAGSVDVPYVGGVPATTGQFSTVGGPLSWAEPTDQDGFRTAARRFVIDDAAVITTARDMSLVVSSGDPVALPEDPAPGGRVVLVIVIAVGSVNVTSGDCTIGGSPSPYAMTNSIRMFVSGDGGRWAVFSGTI